MPHLPKRLEAIRNATASIVRFSLHSGRLYGANDVVYALNAAVDVRNNENVSIKVDRTLLLWAFAIKGDGDIALKYDLFFGYQHDRNILYCSKVEPDGRHEGARNCFAVLGCFSSIDAARAAKVKRLHIQLSKAVKFDLIQFL